MIGNRVPPGILLPLALLLLASLPWSASTGEYHSGAKLICYDCHSMHYSQQHGYDGAPGQGFPPLTGGPNPYLLRESGVNTLCLGCHDGQDFAPDVLGAHGNDYVRQAGALNRAGLGAPYEAWKGHTLDLRARPPGGVSFITIDCEQCHEVHGNAYYRNLSGPVTYTKGQPYASRTKTVDVWLKQWVLGDLPGNYSYDSVRFNEPDTGGSAYADFCAGCHGKFHGNVGGTNIDGSLTQGGFKRHPNAEVNIGGINDGQHSGTAQYGNRINRVHVMSGSNTDYLTAPAGSTTFSVADGLTPSCFSCHKAHGNQNPFGLIFMAASGTVTEEGTTTDYITGIANLCSQCHVQGN